MKFTIAILVIALIWTLYKNRGPKSKRELDAEYQELVTTHQLARENGNAIKSYLLQVLDDCQNDREKFSDGAIDKAAKLFEKAGPGGYYWMAEIASQFIILSAAEINGIPTSVDAKFGKSVTPQQLVEEVVRVNY